MLKQRKNYLLAFFAILATVAISYACFRACNPETQEESCESLTFASLEGSCGTEPGGINANPFEL